MSTPALPSLSDLPAPDALRVEELCSRFEAAWQNAAGPRPRIEEFLGEVEGASRAVLLCELLRLEVAYSRQRGEHATAATYLARFPEQADLVQAVLAEDLAGGWTIAPPPPIPPEDGEQARTGPPSDRAGTSSELRWTEMKQIGKYRIVAVLGLGGQAVTYKGWDPDLQCHVVLKVYHAAHSASQQEVVLEEGQALARVRSPYVARCLHVARFEDVPYLVLEYVPGQTLADLHKTRPLPLPQMLELLAHAAAGLAAVHACGLLHRDLKPANILVGDDGLPRLIDFGLAKPLGDAALLFASGTWAYMPPEQARGDLEHIDPRTDLFGLGAVFYALLTDGPPYRAATEEELSRKALAGHVIPVRERNPKVPAAVAAVCMRCLAAEPSQRFASAPELALALRRLQRRPRMRWLVAAAALLVLALVAGGTSWFLRGRGQQADEVTMRPDGTPLRQDFPLRVTLQGARKDPATGLNRMKDGQELVFQLETPHPCYVGIWYTDHAGEITQLFPNKHEPNHLVPGGTVRQVPGPEAGYSIKAEAEPGPGWIQVIASTEPWNPLRGRLEGPYVVFKSAEEQAQLRAFKIEALTQAISEAAFRVQVDP
jgi:hypothetical protein